MKRKRSRIKFGGWKEAPRKLLSRETQTQRRDWLIAHRIYLLQLLFSEAER